MHLGSNVRELENSSMEWKWSFYFLVYIYIAASRQRLNLKKHVVKGIYFEFFVLAIAK